MKIPPLLDEYWDYLGDGAYCTRDNQHGIWIITTNGESIQNKIYIEPEGFDTLIRYLNREKTCATV